MAVRDRVRWACLHAIAAENTARIIDVVHRGISFACGNSLYIRVFSGFYVDAVCGTGSCAQEAPNALLQAALVAVQHVNSTIAGLKVHRLVRVILRDRLPENVPESHAKASYERLKRLTDFTQYGWHKLKSNKRRVPQQTAGLMPARNFPYFFNASMICFP
jgi:hypothetical protein